MTSSRFFRKKTNFKSWHFVSICLHPNLRNILFWLWKSCFQWQRQHLFYFTSMLYISTSKWVLNTTVGGWNMGFHCFLTFCTCFASFCLILMQKGKKEKNIQSNAGSPKCCLTPCDKISLFNIFTSCRTLWSSGFMQLYGFGRLTFQI